MKTKITKLIPAFALLLSLTFSVNTYATDGDSDEKSYDVSDSSSTDGGDSIPLDGGLSILLLGAAAFGIKKLRDSK